MRFYDQSPIDKACRCYFGGGGGKPKTPKYEAPPMPPAPQAPPPPPPPPEVQNMSASEAGEEARRKAGKRDGIRKSILAGDTGGVVNPATGGGPNSLLG